MPAQAKATLEKIMELLGFAATVEEHGMEDGILLDVKTEDSGRLIGRQRHGRRRSGYGEARTVYDDLANRHRGRSCVDHRDWHRTRRSDLRTDG